MPPKRAETLAPPGWTRLTSEQLVKLAADGGVIVVQQLVGDVDRTQIDEDEHVLVISAEVRPKG